MLNVNVPHTVVEIIAGRKITTRFQSKVAAEKYANAGGNPTRKVVPPVHATRTIMGTAMLAAFQEVR